MWLLILFLVPSVSYAEYARNPQPLIVNEPAWGKDDLFAQAAKSAPLPQIASVEKNKATKHRFREDAPIERGMSVDTFCENPKVNFIRLCENGGLSSLRTEGTLHPYAAGTCSMQINSVAIRRSERTWQTCLNRVQLILSDESRNYAFQARSYDE